MQIIALDPDATIFTKKGDVKNISYQNKPGETTDLPDASVDYIFSTLVFHHLTLAEKRRVLIEIERIIKPNGKFILTDWGRLTAPIFAYYLYVVENKHCIESHFDGRTETLFHELGWHRVVHHRIKLSGIWFSKYLPPSRPKSNCQPDAQ
jgi:ubiquinone/menaquinone biosynthesis C-methylase UbiE